MSDEPAVPKCRRCGYLLVGMPPPRRCPECGALPVRRARWIEGELHLEGRRVVLPVMLRCMLAPALLVLATLAGSVLDPSTLARAKIGVKIDPNWTRLAVDLSMYLATFLWTRPIRASGAGDFGLDRASSARSWAMLAQLPWLVHAALLLALAGAAKSGQPTDAWLPRSTLIVGILGQGSWILTMRHVARIGDFLRDDRIRRSTNLWTWAWLVLTPLGLGWGWISSKYGHGSWPDDSLAKAWAFSNVGLLWGTVNGVLLAWGAANCLTMAIETEASEQRRARREAERYRTPS